MFVEQFQSVYWLVLQKTGHMFIHTCQQRWLTFQISPGLQVSSFFFPSAFFFFFKSDTCSRNYTTKIHWTEWLIYRCMSIMFSTSNMQQNHCLHPTKLSSSLECLLFCTAVKLKEIKLTVWSLTCVTNMELEAVTKANNDEHILLSFVIVPFCNRPSHW